ncbi:MAG: InlB B-repeat-containing protein [Treponema sp.]|nr:InlB B-repeat-containing protein [Treponema sp.]
MFTVFSITGCGPDPFFVPVLSIHDVPDTGTAGTPLVLTGTVNPGFANNRTIIWLINDAGTTGASISRNNLNTQSAGIVFITAKILNGSAMGKDFVQNFSVTINRSIPKYTVSFETNGGGSVDSQIVEEGKTAQRPGNPVKPLWGFVDWYADEALTIIYDFDTPVTGDITIYAKWSTPYTVTFNTNGGSVINSQIIGEGGMVSRPDAPAKSGFIFVDWYSDSGLTALYNFNTPVINDITLYAKWLQSIASIAITVTGPATGDTPNTTATVTGNFSASPVSWLPNDSPFKGSTQYTATVTLTADTGCTFIELAAAAINGNTALVTDNTGTAVTLSCTFAPTPAKAVSLISIKTPPAKLTYTHGEKLDLAGLVVTLTYDDATADDVGYADFGIYNIAANPEHDTALSHSTHNNQPVTITLGSLTPLETGNLTVNTKSIASCTVDPIPAQTYTGSPITPAVTVKDGTATLILNTDYTVAYSSNNTNVGTVTVTITGIGNYNGTYSTTFNIDKTAGIFPALPAINTTYTTTLKLSDVTLPSDYTWDTPATSLSVGDGQSFAATYTDPSGNYEAASGNINVNVAKDAGTFPALPAINTTYTTTLKLSDVTLPSDYTWDAPATSLNAGDGQFFAATYTDPSGNYEAVSSSITVNVAKADGEAVSAPTLLVVTSTSITINTVTAPGNEQSVEYAQNTTNTAPTAGWQTSTTFTGLSAGTSYYIFARAAESTNYNAGTPTGSAEIVFYTVTFDSTGGSTPPVTQVVIPGDKVTEPASPPTKTGFIFGGWYSDAALTTEWVFSTDTVSGNITLYAKWLETYDITLDFGQISDPTPLPILPMSRSGTYPTITYPKTRLVSVSDPGGDYTNIEWLVNNIVVGTGLSFTLDSKDYMVGTHYITLEVWKDGVPYSKTITFEVTE